MAVSPPQLPPLRSLGFYPSYVSAQMAPLTLPTGFDSDSDAVTALSSRKQSRPLPRIPDPSITPARQYTLQSNSAAPPSNEPPQSSSKVTNTSTARARVLSSFMPRTSSSTLLSTLQEHPAIFTSLAAHLDWADLLPLLSTARPFRLLFADPALRDVVLARFVPGYARCVRHRDLAHYQDVHVSIHDLDLLLISQRVGLHRYPMHALRSLTSLYPTPEDDEMSSKLIALTQAHSRFVLLLQSLVHSSNEPMPLEPEEIKWKSRFAPVQNLRELTFPSPLAYTQATPPSPPPKSGTTPALVPKRPSHKLSRSQPTNSPHLTSSAHTPLDFAPHPTLYSMKVGHGPRPSANSLSSMMSNASHPSSKKGRRLSLFGKSSYNTPLPPPPEEPRALKTYSSTWRRSVYPVDGADENGFVGLKSPSRRFGTNASSDSSISGGGCASRNSMVEPLQASSSPHDLIVATSRIRAPILRVFVPCAKLEEGGESVVQCERQLVESGLWEHLSTGDIVCNLGYVPPSAEEGSSDGDDPSPVTPSDQGPQRMNNNNNANSSRKWLLFNGHFLTPYSPPSLLPLPSPLALPSPFYYAHITPTSSNPIYTLSRLPVCDDVPQLTLVHSAGKVPSPHSPRGFALVRKYAWTARVVRIRTGDEGEMGEGWFGEWVLEGEGTREGKEMLLDALGGKEMGPRQWELVREKSGRGKVWLKLLPS